MKKILLMLAMLLPCVGAWAQVDFSNFVGCEVSFTNIQQDGTTKFTLYINDDNVLALSTSSVEELGDAAKFFVEKRANNKYSFYNREKQLYMIWRGLNVGYNSDKGVLDTYNATYCDWTIQDGGELANAPTYYMVSKRSNGNDGSLVVKKTGAFDGWGNSKALAANYSNLYDIKIETNRITYFRLKGYSGNYVDASSIYGNANATNGQMSMKSEENCNYAGTIFYYDNDNKFVNYATGTYVCVGREIAAVGADAGKNTAWDIYCSATKGKFKLYGTYQDNGTKNVWLHDNSGNRADRCSNEADHANTTHSWTLEKVTSLPVTISEAKYATFYAPVAVEVPAEVTAYTVAINGEWATLNEIEGGVIPANTGVVLFAETADTYNFTITNDVAAVADNALLGSAATTYFTTAGSYYALASVDGVVGFYKDAFNNSRFQNNGHKAYLYIANTQGAQALRFTIGGTTAIESVLNGADANAPIYDLSGRRVNNAVKGGIYIQNGKKFIVK